MGIVDEDVARVREAADLVALAGEHSALKRVGRRQVGLCPFHAEKTPSFSINPEEGLYYCFGCQAKGDVITFVREIEHLDFVGSVEWLAAKSGITLRYTSRGESEGHKRRSNLVEALDRAVDWYHRRLLEAPDAGPARSYLRSRDIDGAVARQYRLGWAPDDWDALARSLDLPDAVLRDTGLGFVNRRDRQQDVFRARILFPIFDARGDPVGFGGRTLPGGPDPKYKNTPDTPLYAKSRVLYGLNWMKAGIVEADEAIVCEGYTDVIGLAQVGLPRAVATCGTALTEEHVRTLRRFARRLVLAFDADAAGQAAAERFYQWEQAYEIDVAVAALPSGVDPDDLARSDPDALREAVASAAPFLGFRVERVLEAGSMSSPEGRARAADDALALIAEHPSELVRDQYVMRVAERCRVEPDPLRRRLVASNGRGDRARGAVRVAERPAHATLDRGTSPEIEVLRLAIHRPEEVARYLRGSLFASERHLAAYEALAGADTLHEAIASADPGAADLLQRLAVEDTDAEPLDVVANLVRERARGRLEGLVREIDRTDDLDLTREADRARRDMELLTPPTPDVDALDRLVDWLSLRVEERA